MILIKSCARHEGVYGNMKSRLMVICAVVIPQVVSVVVKANHVDATVHANHMGTTIHMTSQGTHCNGTVGCSCPGFSPITNGDVWQHSYCKYCNHKKSSHK